jgi:flagellar biogenesis protein FliO
MKCARIVAALALLVMTLTSAATSAQTLAPNAHKAWLRTDTHQKSIGGALPSRSGFGKSIAVLLALGVGGYALWRKKRKIRIVATPNKTHIRVISGTLVGPKARAVVAEVGGRLILLGVTEKSVRRLAWLDTAPNSDGDQDQGNTQTRATQLDNAPSASVALSKQLAGAQGPLEARRSRFSDVLSDAIGIGRRAAAEPALVLAESTRDRLTLRASKDTIRNALPVIDVEGQVAGLVSRLNSQKQ